MPFWYGIEFFLRKRKQRKKEKRTLYMRFAFHTYIDIMDKMRKKEDDEQK